MGISTPPIMWGCILPRLKVGGRMSKKPCATSSRGEYWIWAVGLGDSGGYDTSDVAFSPDGAQKIRTLEGHASPVWGLFFSPDGAKLVSTDGVEVRIWQAADGRLLYVGKSACP